MQNPWHRNKMVGLRKVMVTKDFRRLEIYISQWSSTCPACERLWVKSLVVQKKKKKCCRATKLYHSYLLYIYPQG